MYKLSKDLIDGLKSKSINYCHWKSNLLLNEALNGYDDLDLLVKKEDIHRFEILLHKLGFKRASNANLEIQSVHHFYGYDEGTGEILHLHVYYEIKTGPSWTKSLRFNFENYLLDNTIYHESNVLVPEKHIEIVIFIIRVMMKYTKVNEYLLVRKESKRTIREIEYLLDGLNEKGIEEFLNLYFPKISLEDFYKYIETIRGGGYIKKMLHAIQLKRKVKNYIYQGVLLNTRNNASQFVYRVLNKLLCKQKKNLVAGGALIAIVGLDATGKSTVSKDVKRWLGKNFTISHVHFGKPPSTLLTFPLNFVIKILRKRISLQSELRSSTKSMNKQKSYMYMLRQLVLAYDRGSLVRKIWKKTAKGGIVLCDRYKSQDHGVMDSKRLIPDHYTSFKNKMASLENQIYDSMTAPDIMFYLTVSVELAVQRNEDRIKEGKESEEFLRHRHLENKNLSYNAKNLYEIDTNKEYSEVISEIKRIIWSVI